MIDDNDKKPQQEIENNINLDKEIADLDDFLNSQDDDEFSFEDDAATTSLDKDSANKSGGMGKYISYAILLATLGGIGYAGMKFAPQLMGTAALNDLQANITERNFDDNFVGFDTAADSEPVPLAAEVTDLNVTNSVMIEPEQTQEVQEQMPAAPDEFMPMASSSFDDVQNDESEVVLDENQTIEQGVTSEITQANMDVSIDDGDATVAQTISEALQAAQNVEPDVTAEIIETVDNTLNVEQNMTEMDVAPQAPDLMVNMERIPATPMISDNQGDLPPLDNESIDTANQVMQMTEEEIVETVEAADEVAAQVSEIAEEAPLDDVIQNSIVEGAVDEVVADVAEIAVTEDAAIEPETIEMVVEDTVTEAEAVVEELETVEVATPKAEPVKTELAKVAKPSEPVINNKPVVQNNPKLKTARAAYDKGDYKMALDLYNQVLNANPADTSALTGRQLATAKLRMNAQSAPQAEVPSMTAPAATAQTQALQTLIAQMNANPRDAITALKLGDAYRDAGNNAMALDLYRKALQLDVIYPAGMDRMSVYDRMADIQ